MTRHMRYWFFGYRKFSIRYNIGLKYRQYLYRKILKRYRIVKTRFFNILIEKMRFFDILIKNKSISKSILYQNYFDIDINIDIVLHRIKNFDLYIEMQCCSIKKIRICLSRANVINIFSVTTYSQMNLRKLNQDFVNFGS